MSRAAPRIHYNFFDDQSDRDPLVGPVRLSRKTGRTAPFSALINHQMAPGKRVDDQALRTNIVSNVAAYLHPTLTVPMGADSDPTAVVDAWGKGLERRSVARRRVDHPRHSIGRAERDDDHGGRAHRGKTVSMSSRHPRYALSNGSGRNYRVIWAKSFGTPADPHDWQTRAYRRPLIARSTRLRSLSMIVFGAYSHARWAESIFGGVTRILLTQIPVPVLVSR